MARVLGENAPGADLNPIGSDRDDDGLDEELEDTQALPLPGIDGSESEIPRDRGTR